MRYRNQFFTLLALLSAVARLGAADQNQNQLDASEQLFTVLAAANAIGYDAGLATSPPIRKQIRDRVAAANAPVVKEMKDWYSQHYEPDPAEGLARFISLGLSLKAAPGFEWNKREVEIPPDAFAMNGFREMLPRFYEQAHIALLWSESQAAIEHVLVQYQEPVAQAILEANAYLRNPPSGFLGRRFQIYIDFLASPNQIQTRSFGDDFYIVITPSAEPRIAEIRHAYLRYLLDPLAIKYGVEINKNRSLMDIAEAAPLLREPYRSNFDMFTSESLIKAVESRLLHNPKMIEEATGEGYILAPFFNEQLAVYEASQDSFRLFFPQMIAALSPRKETRRLEGVKFLTEAPKKPAPKPVAPAEPDLSASARKLAEADAAYEKKDLDGAQQLYERALQLPGTPAEHAQAFYGMGHIALNQKNPDRAEELFHKTLDSNPSPEVRAWSCYYLGKLAQNTQDGAEEAVKWFQQVTAQPGATPKLLDLVKKELAKPPAGVEK